MSFTYFTQKSEKLATAIYMITDIIDAREPLRWKVREEAMNVMSMIATLQSGDSIPSWNVLYRVAQSIERVEHLIGIARAAKLMSEMNSDVVKREYQDLKERLKSSWGTLEEKASPKIQPNFFRIERIADDLAPRFPQPTLTDMNASVARKSDRPTQSDNREVSDKPQNVRHVSPIIRTDMHVQVRETKNERRRIIRDIILQKGETSVTELMRLIPDVTDKTIQRELVAMVESGELVKRGEKRWSTYLMAPSPAPQSQTPKAIPPTQM